MGQSRVTSPETDQPAPSKGGLAKSLAPEEIRRGDFVTPLYVISEWPSWFWCDDDALHSREEPIRLRLTPSDEAHPLKVRSVCLPFVLVKSPLGDERTLDVRRCRLARLSPKYARAAWKAYRRARPKRARRS